MSLLLVFIAIAIAGGTIMLATGRLRGPELHGPEPHSSKRGGPEPHGSEPHDSKSHGTEPHGSKSRGPEPDVAFPRWKRGGASEVDAMAEPAATMPPVLLPDRPEPRDIAGLRFSVAFRGYRMDQVDAVLKSLASDLVQRNEQLAELVQRNELLAELVQRNELLAELRQQDGKAGGH